MTRWFLLCLLLPIWGCTTPYKNACLVPDQETRAAIVRIATSTGSNASGVIVGQGQVLTVAHALDDIATADLRVSVEIAGYFREAKVLRIDLKKDLALLSVDTAGLKPASMGIKGLSELEQVWAVGFPLALEQRTTLGLFQRADGGRLYSNVHVNSGSSGGGLFRCQGGAYELVGVLRAFIAYRIGDELVNIGESTSVPVDQIVSFLASAPKLARGADLGTGQAILTDAALRP
ncbi:MAG: trypsin-like peptidase domain-containing protein [Gammaproteobacteria bacterium]